MECKQEENKKSCACTYGCSKSGNCCACVRNHRGMGEFPACFFSPQAEKKYDRSYAALVADRNSR